MAQSKTQNLHYQPQNHSFSKAMKRKKWSELEEKTLLSKYAELLNSGALAKLKTREKKFKPIADHVNTIHHLQDPINYPFKWSWRDVSIKVQNMRHQYLGVKQKIRISDGEFNWDDGENHWENFLMYKEVFGDVQLEVKDYKKVGNGDFNEFGFLGGNGDDGLGLGFDIDCDDFEEDEEVGEEEGESRGFVCGEMEETEEKSGNLGKKLKKRRMAMLGSRVLEVRDVLVKRDEKRKDREFVREEGLLAKEVSRREMENLKEKRLREAEEKVEEREMELEEMQLRWTRKEFDRQTRLERELDEERRWRMKMEEKREEEELEWRERMLGLQIEHEKQMMQMHADACQNQLQILGIMARFMCQFFGSAGDGLGGGLGGLPPQVLQNLQHPGPGDLGDDSKPVSDSPPEFM
ncbi:Cortactin-binding protein 2 [Bienertia sinuspersici]